MLKGRQLNLPLNFASPTPKYLKRGRQRNELIHYILRIWKYRNSFREKCYFGHDRRTYSSFFKPNQSLLQSISTSHWCSFFLSTALPKKGPKLSCQPHKFSTRLWVLMVPAYQEAIKSRLVNRPSMSKQQKN